MDQDGSAWKWTNSLPILQKFYPKPAWHNNQTKEPEGMLKWLCINPLRQQSKEQLKGRFSFLDNYLLEVNYMEVVFPAAHIVTLYQEMQPLTFEVHF